jgi:hypothetical protein
MPGKVPQPWYRKATESWYVCIAGRQHRLGDDKEEAFRCFHLLMAGEAQMPAKPARQKSQEQPQPLTVKALVERYLSDAQRRMKPNTYRVVRDFANSFATLHGSLPAEAVRKHHVEQWVAEHPTWGTTTVWDAIPSPKENRLNTWDDA